MAQGTTAALEEPARRSRRWQFGPAVAAAVFALVLLLGIPFVVNQEDTGPSTGTEVGAPLEPLPQGGPLAPDRYLLSNTGLPVTAEFPEGLEVTASEPGLIEMEPLFYPSEVARRSVIFVRPNVLSMPSGLSVDAPTEGGWPLGDIEGWASTLPPGIGVESLESTSIDGSPASRLLIEIQDSFACGAIDGCASFIRWQGGVVPLTKGSPWLIWWIEVGEGQEPLALVAPLGIDDEFIDIVDGIATSIQLG